MLQCADALMGRQRPAAKRTGGQLGSAPFCGPRMFRLDLAIMLLFAAALGITVLAKSLQSLQ
jgi:hypothetical protein